MNSKLLAALLVTLLLLCGTWNCKEVTPTGTTTGTATISGVIYDANSSAVLEDAIVTLTMSGFSDSMETDTSGAYQFQVDFSKVQSQSATLTVRKSGYVTKSVSLTLQADTTLNIAIHVDLSTSALVTGTVRDSSSLYPLRNASILLVLPGFTDSTVTPKEGTFRFTADLVDLDSLSITLTVYKSGYKTRHVTAVLHKGETYDFGNVLLSVDVSSTVGTLLGRVYDSQTLLPLTNANATVITSIMTDSVKTTSSGDYSFSVDLEGLSTINGSLNVTKSGYKSQSFSFTLEAGKSVSEDFYLVRDTTTGIVDSSGTGLAHSIAFISMTTDQIAVYGVGGTEASILTWEVRDSLGFAIDIDHCDTVFFQLEGTPVTGGAYVSPAWAITNASGRVATTVNSGTVSGVIQFIAYLRRESDGAVITSSPVIITINAGLPDQAHFSVGPASFNFAGYDWINHTDVITVQVGDKYSNPVETGTAVYFNTTGGIIDASGFTDATSHASVTLYSGNPRPMFFPRDTTRYPSSLYGDSAKGYTWIRAYTMGENSVQVVDSTLVLMSGMPEIHVDTTGISLSIPSGGCVTVPVTVSDENGNPLAAGTAISVVLQYSPPTDMNWSVIASGLPSDPLSDLLVRGPGATDFSLTICDGTAGGTTARMPFTATIKVTGPNGNVNYSFTGSVGP